uniref:Uncharacterized protein n=1 Tax=Bionectria ochroleuca TaxID=29856 RepID=A0A0B7JTE0_BIOOC
MNASAFVTRPVMATLASAVPESTYSFPYVGMIRNDEPAVVGNDNYPMAINGYFDRVLEAVVQQVHHHVALTACLEDLKCGSQYYSDPSALMRSSFQTVSRCWWFWITA